MGLLDQFKAYIDANTPRSTRPAVSPQNVIYAGLLQQPIENIKANAAGLLGEIQRAPKDLAALASPQMYAKALKAMNTPQPVDKQKWIDAGMELSGMAPLGGLMAHTVYHGSPHKFDKFDMSKIGTGEGAQAYGHGLYFAESPNVAEGYARALNPNAVVAKANTDAQGTAQRVLEAVGFNREKAIKELTNRKQMPHVLDNPEWQQKMDDAISYINGVGGNTSSNLYKVDIPDEAIPRMLDWDKPLSEQAPEVQDMLRAAGIADSGNWLKTGMSGREIHNAAKIGAPAKLPLNQADDYIFAANRLKEAGIPGIRYLDGGSRSAGQGSSNFVLFDDQLARIIERNGQPTGLLPWQEGEWLNLKSK